MKQEAYLDLVKSSTDMVKHNLDVLMTNVMMAMETQEDDNKSLVERVFMLEKENMRLVTENRMMKEECNRLKAEVIKLIDTVGNQSTPVEDIDDFGLHGFSEERPCDKCKYDIHDQCPSQQIGRGCPDGDCCKEFYKDTDLGECEHSDNRYKCEYGTPETPCPEPFIGDQCPEVGCCKKHFESIKSMESDTNETH